MTSFTSWTTDDVRAACASINFASQRPPEDQIQKCINNLLRDTGITPSTQIIKKAREAVSPYYVLIICQLYKLSPGFEPFAFIERSSAGFAAKERNDLGQRRK